MPIIDAGQGALSPGQIELARRVLAHRTKRTYAKGSVGITVKAIKTYLVWKGFDPGSLNTPWDDQAQKAFTAMRKVHGRGESRATPSVVRAMSKDIGRPAPRPPRSLVTQASMRPIMPGALEQGGDALRQALSGVPPASGVGDQPGMMSTEDAAAMARNADRSLGALQNPDVMPSPADGGMPFGPGNGADDMLQQGYGTETPLVPKNSDYIPPVHGQAEAGPPGDLGASDGGLLNWDPSAIDPPDPAVMPSPAEGGMPFGPGNGANDILQQQLRPPTNWPPDLSALGDLSPMGAPPMGPPPPAQMGAPPPPTPPIPDMGAPPPPLPDQGGGLTAEDLVPPDPNSAGAAPPPPDPTGAGDLGALPGDPTAPPDPMMAGASGAPGPGAMPLPPPDPGPGGMPPPPPDAGPDAMPPPSPDAGPGAPPMPPTPPPLPPTDDDTTVAGDLGTLDPSLRAPDEMGQAPNSKRRRDQPYDFPNNDMPLPPMRPELGDLTGSTPPSDAGGSSQRMIKKGDTLWAIAEQEYGDPRLWPLIAKANPGIKDPNLIHYGKTLTIPAI